MNPSVRFMPTLIHLIVERIVIITQFVNIKYFYNFYNVENDVVCLCLYPMSTVQLLFELGTG